MEDDTIACHQKNKTLLQVGVRVEEEDTATGKRHHCCSAYLTFVNITARGGGEGGGANARPARALPRVVPSEGDVHLEEVQRSALARRDLRLKMKRQGMVRWVGVTAVHPRSRGSCL